MGVRGWGGCFQVYRPLDRSQPTLWDGIVWWGPEPPTRPPGTRSRAAVDGPVQGAAVDGPEAGQPHSAAVHDISMSWRAAVTLGAGVMIVAVVAKAASKMLNWRGRARVDVGVDAEVDAEVGIEASAAGLVHTYSSCMACAEEREFVSTEEADGAVQTWASSRHSTDATAKLGERLKDGCSRSMGAKSETALITVSARLVETSLSNG